MTAPIKTLAWLGVVVYLLAACAPAFKQPSPQQQAAWQTHQVQVSNINRWQLNAHFAIASESEAWSARVYWQQHPADYALRFTAPLGQGVMRLRGNPNGVQLQTAQQQTLYADSPETLLQQATDLTIPISYLYYWVRGLPAPDSPARYALDAQGRLQRLQQADWTVEYATYAEVANIDLPRKLFLQNPEFQGKIVISEWLL